MKKIIKRRVRNRNTDRDYISGPILHSLILEWYESEKEEPPKAIIDAITQICKRLATKHNFKNYTYIDEMIAEGLLACTIAVIGKKYDPYNWSNPFAYFTQIAYNAFISVIKVEHKETYIKHKELENYIIDANIRGESIVEYKQDDSGRIENLIKEFETVEDE